MQRTTDLWWDKDKGMVKSKVLLTERNSEMNQINVTAYCQEIAGCFAAVFDKVKNPVFFEGNYMDALHAS